MGGRGDRHGLGDGIDAGGMAVSGDGRVSGEDAFAQRLSRIEEDLPARLDLPEIGAGDDVARGKLGVRMDGFHEALAGIVDENGALTAQGFGGKRGGIAAGQDRRWVELDEFGIGDDGPGPRRHAHGVAAHRGGIGGCRIKPAQPPGRQHGSAGADEDRLHIAVAQPAAEDADDAPLGMGEIDGGDAFDHADGGCLPYPGNDRLHDGMARPVARNAHHAVGRMGRLAREDELTKRVAIKRSAPIGEIVDTGSRLGGDRRGDAVIDNAGTSHFGIECMGAGRIPLAHRSGDAALRPGRGGA